MVKKPTDEELEQDVASGARIVEPSPHNRNSGTNTREQQSSSTNGFFQEVARLAAFGICYFIAARVGLLFIMQPEGIASIWPPSGLALAALILMQQRKWVLLVIFATNTVGNLTGGNSLPMSLGFALANSIEAAAGAWVLLHFFGPKITFAHVKEVIALCGVATLSNGITAFLGAAVPALALGAPFFDTWFVWWVSDALGIILLTPVIVTWATSANVLQALPSRRFVEGAILIAALSALTWLIMGYFATIENSLFYSYMVFPLLIWAAFRFSPRGTATALLFFAVTVLWNIVQGDAMPELVDQSLKESVLSVQILLFVVTLSGLTLAAVVAERKQTEEALIESEAKFRTQVEKVPAITYTAALDEYSTTQYISPQIESLLGFTQEEYEEDTNLWDKQLHPDDRERVLKEVAASHQSHIPFVSEYRMLTKNGRIVWFRDEAVMIEDKAGKPLFFQGMMYDITERKQAEEALRKSEEKYRSLTDDVLDSSAAGIFILDSDFRIVWVNRALEDYFGLKRNEIIGKDKRQLIHESIKDVFENPDSFVNKVFNTYDDNTYLEHFECHVIANDEREERWLEHRSQPIQSGLYAGGRIEHYYDISNQKQVEKKMKEMQAQLIQSQKMEAVGTLAGGVAHDFNNLLTVIIGNAQLALMDVIKDESLRKEIEEIKKAGNKAASLTRQLLAFSRKQVIKPEVINMNEGINETEKMLKRMIGEDIEFLTVLESELWKVYADSGQIDQVIMNLAVNARDAMPKGGKLTIETANKELDDTYFRDRGVESAPGPYVMLAISDTGIGMNKETRENIFEPFFTTKEVGKGTGLGLSTVYGIVKQNNGFVWVYSEPGQGSTFKVYLPKVRGDAEPEEKEQSPVDDLSGSEIVLIVEDDDGLRKFAQEVLQSYGYRTLNAENGEDALRVSKEHEGPIHLLLTDVVMPKMGGKKLAERLQPFYPRMKLIYMSGYTDNAIVRHGVLEPGLNFLEKPFTPEGLARKVRGMLDE